jgi:hypothetical protein
MVWSDFSWHAHCGAGGLHRHDRVHLYAESLLDAERHVAGEVGLADGAGGATRSERLPYSGRSLSCSGASLGGPPGTARYRRSSHSAAQCDRLALLSPFPSSQAEVFSSQRKRTGARIASTRDRNTPRPALTRAHHGG